MMLWTSIVVLLFGSDRRLRSFAAAEKPGVDESGNRILLSLAKMELEVPLQPRLNRSFLP